MLQRLFVCAFKGPLYGPILSLCGDLKTICLHECWGYLRETKICIFIPSKDVSNGQKMQDDPIFGDLIKN
jgi:hypothetical protein